jgi:ABC-type Fe3+-hydroxamate transport system substrate-binding protein
MLEHLARFLRWNMRLWYPILRILGRVTGQQDRVETWIEVTEENIQNTLDALGDE